ncbi:hypothetical protein RND71_012832 [Anisodus tanguticus]|uniref:Uncharacterized protein n=1 Tax=Anisodus tanguticus TaxID=243964 RepID=A0AAE1VR24_9SOLA|nr:hypothetical protein RND71_012832 [Anisodus tanguticus]
MLVPVFKIKHSCCSIWVMKEYGVVESWSNEFNVSLDTEPGMILGFRNYSEILLTRSTGQLVSYNLETHEKMNFGIVGTKNSFFIGTYEEILVLLNEGELLFPNDFSYETDQDDYIENRNAQMSELWTQLLYASISLLFWTLEIFKHLLESHQINLI